MIIYSNENKTAEQISAALARKGISSTTSIRPGKNSFRVFVNDRLIEENEKQDLTKILNRYKKTILKITNDDARAN